MAPDSGEAKAFVVIDAPKMFAMMQDLDAKIDKMNSQLSALWVIHGIVIAAIVAVVTGTLKG